MACFRSVPSTVALVLSALLILLLALVSSSAHGVKLPDDAEGLPLCYRHPNPLKPNQREPVPCDIVNEKPANVSGIRGLKEAVAGTGKFVLQFSCPSSDSSCQSAQSTFQQAFTILQSYLVLADDIIVNASMSDLCVTIGQCGSNGFQILGGAAPERSHVLLDDDGVKRAYPQALVKQLQLSSHPAYSGSDIFAQFNIAAKFHYPDDPTPMGQGESDFLFVVLHEMVHGLGFTSAWDDYINDQAQALTPGVSLGTIGGKLAFNGFIENEFDRFMIETTTNQPLSARTAALNGIQGLTGSTFQSANAFAAALQQSSVYVNQGTQVLKLATTPNALTFASKNGSKMVLETTLSPYSPGSSVSHCDARTFSGTADFLMRFRVDPGTSLAQATSVGTAGPIGPVLLSVLDSLGYTTQNNPVPVNEAMTSGKSCGTPSRTAVPISMTMVALVVAPFGFLTLARRL